MNEKIDNKLLAIPITISYSFIALFCFFCIGLSRVDASSWMQFNSTNDSYICGTNTDYLECTIGTENNGVYTNPVVDNYMIIIENIQLSANKSYTIDLTWNFSTYAMNNNESGYITRSNYSNFTSYIISKFGTATGVDLPTENKTWQLLSSQLIPKDGGTYALYSYKYSNVFELGPNENYQRLFFKIVKRQQWNSMAPNSGIRYPSVIISQLSYTISEIGDNGTANIIAAGNKNAEDIINSNNANTDKVIGSLTDETAPNLDAFDDMSGWLPPGPLDSVLNIPLNILNGLVGAFSNNSCSAISIPIPFIGGILDLPCLYSLYSNINGLSIALTTFFTAIAGYLMFKYLSNLYVWIDKTLKMEESSYMQDWGGV